MSVSIQRPSILSTDAARSAVSSVNNGATYSAMPPSNHHQQQQHRDASPLSHSNPGYAPLSTVNRLPDPWCRSPTTTTPPIVSPLNEAAAYRPAAASSHKDQSNGATAVPIPSSTHQEMHLLPMSPTPPQPRLSHEQVCLQGVFIQYFLGLCYSFAPLSNWSYRPAIHDPTSPTLSKSAKVQPVW